MTRRVFITGLLLLTLPSIVYSGAFDDFFKAIQFDDEQGLRNLLLKGMDPNTVNEQGFPAITFAMLQNSPNAVNVLMQTSKLDANQADRRGEIPLMVACTLNKPEWVSALLSLGAVQGTHGQWTALHNAAAAGSVESIELLVKAGGEVDVLSPNETTPLMMAARAGKENAVHLLLNLGANPALVNQAGYNAAGYAIRAGREALAMHIMKIEKARRTTPSIEHR